VLFFVVCSGVLNFNLKGSYFLIRKQYYFLFWGKKNKGIGVLVFPHFCFRKEGKDKFFGAVVDAVGRRIEKENPDWKLNCEYRGEEGKERKEELRSEGGNGGRREVEEKVEEREKEGRGGSEGTKEKTYRPS
jgi:hypothetical protein